MINNQAPLGKVTAFITRDAAQERELLLFRHPSGGIQLPAGTVEENESSEVAAWREAREETGLDTLTAPAFLGAERQPLRPDERVVLRRTPLRERPAPDAPEVSHSFVFHGLRRGLYVRKTGRARNGYAPVTYDEFDTISDGGMATPTRSMSGWLNTDDITDAVTRYAYHFMSIAPTPDTWTQSAEEWQHRLELFWSPLPIATSLLIPSQAVWLRDYADRLGE